MKKTFLNRERPLLTVMLTTEDPEDAIATIQKANGQGADAYGIQIEHLLSRYHTPEAYQRLFAEMGHRPCYVTYYRSAKNQGKTDEELAQGLLTLAKSGAVLCDVMGDLFCRHPEELTDDPAAIQKQMDLVDKLHSLGAEVLMSSHLFKFVPAERVLEIAREQKRRGADIIKIVTHGNSMAQQIENLRITDLLKQELDAPFLFLSGGECSLHRRLGMKLGCCMALCVYEHNGLSTPAQPLFSTMQTIRNLEGEGL